MRKHPRLRLRCVLSHFLTHSCNTMIPKRIFLFWEGHMPEVVRVCIARIRAVLRRTGGRPTGVDVDDRLTVGPLSIDRRTHRIHLDGEEVPFTPKEFELLVFLAEDAGAVCTRTDIVEHVWDANWFGPTKTVDAHVASIRRKLGSHSWIESVRGVGFRLVEPSGS